MRALFVIPEYPPHFGGGIATYYGGLLPSLLKLGVEVTAIVGSYLSDLPAGTADRGVNIIPIDRERVRALKTKFPEFALAPDFCGHLAAAWTAWEQAKEGRGYDVVECTDWGLFFVPWLVSNSAPATLIRMHASIGQIGTADPQNGYLLSESLARFTEDVLLPYGSVATYGRANQRYWADRLAIPVDYAAPPAQDFSGSLPSSLQPSDRGLVVGRVQAWKGPETLCKALSLLGASSPEIDWYGRDLPIAGSQQTMGKILQANYPSIWGGKIKNRPPEEPAFIRRKQSEARFVVVPSNWDVFNFTASEAMSAGVPVICSAGAGASDLIEDGRNGYLFPAGDHEQLAGKIRLAASLSPEQKLSMGRAAKATIMEHLSSGPVALQHMRQLQAAVSKPRHIPSPDRSAMFSPSASYSSCLGTAGLSQIPMRELAAHLRHRVVKRLLPNR